MENKNYNLEYPDILEDIRKATVDSKHPYRYAGLSTVSSLLGPRSRIVVLRQLTPSNRLIIYTDSRSGKIEDIEYDNRVSILCYDPTARQQLRIQGTASIITHGELYNKCLEKITSRNIDDYNSINAPGSIVNENGEIHRQDKLEFSLLSIEMSCLDYLEINPSGHRRFSFKKREEEWTKERLIP